MAKNAAGEGFITGLVPEGGFFEGRIFAPGRAAIEGTVVGPIETRDALVVGPKARVDGPVRAGVLELSGRVDGDVVALERASLAQGATLRGTLKSPRVSIAEGALLEGPCQVGPVDDGSKSRPGLA